MQLNRRQLLEMLIAAFAIPKGRSMVFMPAPKIHTSTLNEINAVTQKYITPRLADCLFTSSYVFTTDWQKML